MNAHTHHPDSTINISLHLLYHRLSHLAALYPPINLSCFLMPFHAGCRHQDMSSLTSADTHFSQSKYTSPRTLSKGLANFLLSSMTYLGSEPICESYNTDLPTRGIWACNTRTWHGPHLTSLLPGS